MLKYEGNDNISPMFHGKSIDFEDKMQQFLIFNSFAQMFSCFMMVVYIYIYICIYDGCIYSFVSETRLHCSIYVDSHIDA